MQVAATSPAQILSLQKIRGQIRDAVALETIAHYLVLLEEVFLVVAIAARAGVAAVTWQTFLLEGPPRP